ncbi:hypothetical protein PUN28_005309 [Cardiocondyla obscurior]|uniref:Uncharacterized protein n=1 Tax=Cardiocondyla obscurior TaxID=286306 RepID=A0AAW2GJT5_9HYME
MGNYTSKLLFYTTENRKESNEHQEVVQQIANEDNVCTPVLSDKKILGDPRSISTGIKRTPIEIKSTPVGVSRNLPNAIPKYLQKKPYLETNLDVTPELSPGKPSVLKHENCLTPETVVSNKLKKITPIDEDRLTFLGLDPRSPAADFDRTPILIPKSLVMLKARSLRLNRDDSYESYIHDSENSHQKTLLNIPEIQLCNITITENLETSLVTEKQDEPIPISQHNHNLNIFESEKEITIVKNVEEDKDKTDKQDYKNIKSNTTINNTDKVELWHDSSSSEESVTAGTEDWKEASQEKFSKEDVIITFDKHTMDSASLTLIKSNEDFRKKKDMKGKKKRNAKIDVKLDEKKVFTPENKHGTETYENRTPLGNRSNNDQIQKKPQQLLRNMSIGMQQENTPPNRMFNGQTRNGNQWDSNSTVLI